MGRPGGCLHLGRCAFAASAACALAAVGAATAPPAVARERRPGLPPFASALTDLAEVVLCLASLWLAVATVLAAAGALLGPGSLPARVALRVSPRAWRRLLAVVLGSAIVIAPAYTGAASPESTDGPRLAGLRLPDRPVGGAAAPADGGAAAVVVVRRGDTLWDIAAASLPAGADDAGRAAACHRWYSANRAVIGPDPDLLLPGTRLRSPEPHERTNR